MFNAPFLGDQYVKDEFRRHKSASDDYVKVFMNEWTNYAIIVSEQLSVKKSKKLKTIGATLTENHLDGLSDEQAAQLLELYREASGGITSENSKEPQSF